MIKIRLRESNQHFIVDDEDVKFVCQWGWKVRKSKDYGVFIYRINKYNKFVYLHEEIITKCMRILIPNGFKVDYVNRDGRNNTRNNLRIVIVGGRGTLSGVCWEPKMEKWITYYRKIYIGSFDIESDATNALIKVENEEIGK